MTSSRDGRGRTSLTACAERRRRCLADDVPRNAADVAAGFRHLLVLLGIGLDSALRRGLRIGPGGEALRRRQRSTSGVWTAPTASTPGLRYEAARPTACGATAARPAMSGCSRWRAWRRRRTSCWTSWISDPTAKSTSSSRTDPHEGNWLPDRRERDHAGHPSLLLRLGHRGGFVALHRADRGRRERADRPADDPRAVVARQLIALGDFVVANLDFFLQFSRPETPNTFLPPLDGTAMGAAAENRPVIGSWELGPTRHSS